MPEMQEPPNGDERRPVGRAGWDDNDEVDPGAELATVIPLSAVEAGDELLTLQEAADRLKVHYMTAYRWVRRGELPAFKAGGRLRVRAGDLSRFLHSRAVDVALPSGATRRTEWPVHVDRLHGLLVEGRVVDAGALVRKVVADGAPAGEVYVKLITPALHRVGDDWADGRITIAEEHRATEIMMAVMARLGEFFRRRGPSRGTAVTLTPADEPHGLAAWMAADFLRAAGWDVHHLGASVPPADLRAFLSVVSADVLCVSVTTRRGDVAQRIAALVDAARPVRVIVGGQGADPSVVAAAGAHHLDELPRLAEALDGLVASPAR